MNGRARMLLSRAQYLTRKIAAVDPADRRIETWRKDRAACVEGAAAIAVLSKLDEIGGLECWLEELAAITTTLDIERAEIWKDVLDDDLETARPAGERTT